MRDPSGVGMLGERKIIVLALALAAVALGAPGAEALSGVDSFGTQGGTSFTSWLVHFVGGAIDYLLYNAGP